MVDPKYVKDGVRLIDKWLEDHVEVWEEPAAVTLFDFEVNWDSFSGSFTLALDDYVYEERLHFGLQESGKVGYALPIFGSPLGVPASYAAVEMTARTSQAISKALRETIPKVRGCGINRETGQLINFDTPPLERINPEVIEEARRKVTADYQITVRLEEGKSAGATSTISTPPTETSFPSRERAILIPDETKEHAAEYLEALRIQQASPGALLSQHRSFSRINEIDELDLLGMLFDTKQPQIFAEIAVHGDGSDWTLTELGLLGDISIGVPVTVYDNGHHTAPSIHAEPFEATLVYTPGALLRCDNGNTPADWDAVTDANGNLSHEKYVELYRRRLLPVFQYINARATQSRPALVTMPGLGCGQFAGPFAGQLGEHLSEVIATLLEAHGRDWPNIKAVYFDPYSECSNERYELNGISYMVRPLCAPDNEEKHQLSRPETLEDPGDDFSACELFSLVAWDHVSWPGNDFFAGARSTDDGVKAAATDSMKVITGTSGEYDAEQAKYLPPKRFSNWKQALECRPKLSRPRLWNHARVWYPPEGFK
jgi:hypothetical protein